MIEQKRELDRIDEGLKILEKLDLSDNYPSFVILRDDEPSCSVSNLAPELAVKEALRNVLEELLPAIKSMTQTHMLRLRKEAVKQAVEAAKEFLQEELKQEDSEDLL